MRFVDKSFLVKESTTALCLSLSKQIGLKISIAISNVRSDPSNLNFVPRF